MNTSPHCFGYSLSHQLTALCACACLILAMQASAGPSLDPPPSLSVGYADLDLSTTEGAAVLYGRIRRAAARVCGPMPVLREIKRYDLWQTCLASATSNAVATVNRPALTALHRARTGESEAAPAFAQDRTRK